MKKEKYLFKLFAVFFLVLFLVVGVGFSVGEARFEAQRPQVVGGFGVTRIYGEDVIVHVLVEVPLGETAKGAVNSALASYGARPIEEAHFDSGKFSVIGRWETLNVVQNYNSAGEPNNGAKEALKNTHYTWTGVEESDFALSYGENTTRCPSLVQECRGPQYLDGNNDLAWLRLRPGVLGVAWIASQGGYIVEVDIALSTRFNWDTEGGDYDIETVILHENGHLLGLGHSENPKAVMYAYYNSVKQELHEDDEAGIIYLYPSDGIDPDPEPEPDPDPDPDDPGDSDEPEDKCPPGWARRGIC